MHMKIMDWKVMYAEIKKNVSYAIFYLYKSHKQCILSHLYIPALLFSPKNLSEFEPGPSARHSNALTTVPGHQGLLEHRLFKRNVGNQRKQIGRDFSDLRGSLGTLGNQCPPFHSLFQSILCSHSALKNGTFSNGKNEYAGYFTGFNNLWIGFFSPLHI
jgi:hypothetical protein